MKKLTFLVIAAFFVSCVDLSNSPTHDYYTLRVNASPEAGGTATPNPKKDVYVSGENVTVTAAPSAGYTFTGWAGAVTGTANQVTVTMNGDKQLTAIFQKIEAAAPAYTLTADASPPDGGTVSLAPDKTSYAAGEKVKATADTADGYAFTGWSGASEATTDTVTIRRCSPISNLSKRRRPILPKASSLPRLPIRLPSAKTRRPAAAWPYRLKKRLTRPANWSA